MIEVKIIQETRVFLKELLQINIDKDLVFGPFATVQETEKIKELLLSFQGKFNIAIKFNYYVRSTPYSELKKINNSKFFIDNFNKDSLKLLNLDEVRDCFYQTQNKNLEKFLKFFDQCLTFEVKKDKQLTYSMIEYFQNNLELDIGGIPNKIKQVIVFDQYYELNSQPYYQMPNSIRRTCMVEDSPLNQFL